ncbi:MAG: NUDIX hydrolase [Streptosporangiaceae bacterium]|nr:NUDIX hydrolase [Streptosporangiaceae bacterium]
MSERVQDSTAQWPVESSTELLSSRLITVRSDKVGMPGNHWAERDVVEHPGAVAILALDDAERVLMIRQYRHPVGRLLWEIPAGLRDVPGEDLLVTARRELLEEAGYEASQWHVLVDYFTSPGFSTERLRIFLARGVKEVPEEERTYVREDEEADMARTWLPLQEAVRRVQAGDLHNGVAAMGILAVYAARLSGFEGLRPPDAPET